jgi:molybdopterin molybdotransferase
MPAAGEIIHAEPLFRGVQMKPGGWITGLYREPVIILCLSGNPGAAAVSFDLLAAPVIRRLAGAESVLPKRISGALREGFSKPSHTRRFLYASLEGGGVSLPPDSRIHPIGCNCILDIPAG